jgi:hypothetical protein
MGQEFVSGGILLWGGEEASLNQIDNVSISSNSITSAVLGVNLIGGVVSLQTKFSANSNEILHVEISNNSVSNPSSLITSFYPNARGINFAGGFDKSSGNSLQSIIVSDNTVGGILDDFSILDNVGSGSSANTVTLLTAVSDYFVPVNGVNFSVALQTNSSISALSYNQAAKSLTFTLDGPSITAGFANVIIPRNFLEDTFVMSVNGNQIPFKLITNATDYFLFATFPSKTSTLTIAVLEAPTTTAVSTSSTASSGALTTTTTTNASSSPMSESSSSSTATSGNTATSSQADTKLELALAGVVVAVLAGIGGLLLRRRSH